MRRFSALLALCGAAVFTSPAAAQGWSVSSDHVSDWFHATVAPEGGAISFSCIDHYPGADWSYGEGGGPYDPYLIHISMNETIGIPGEAQFSRAVPLDNVILVIGNTGYQLPGVTWNEMVGDWGLAVSVGDPLITALLAGGDMQLWSGGVLVGELPGRGLAPGMAEAIAFCDSHWIASGAPLPSHAAITMQSLRNQPPPPAAMEDVVLARITSDCGGPGEVRADAVLRSDFDGDGVEDILLHWSGVTCRAGTSGQALGPGAGQCGASHCLTSVYVSSQIQAGAPPYELLSLSARLDPANPTDILLGVGLADCAAQNLQPTCLTRHRWSGAEFLRIE